VVASGEIFRQAAAIWSIQPAAGETLTAGKGKMRGVFRLALPDFRGGNRFESVLGSRDEKELDGFEERFAPVDF